MLTGVEGIGGSASVCQSKDKICLSLDGHTCTIVTIMSLPLKHCQVEALIGRDILMQLGARLMTKDHF